LRLVDGAGWRRERHGLGGRWGDGFEGQLAEGLFVLCQIVSEDVPEGFCLLGAEVDCLEVVEVDLGGRSLLHGAEDELEVPDGHANLDGVGVAFAVFFGLFEVHFGLGKWIRRILAHGVVFQGLQRVGAEEGT
jgi:hypothetical protein